MLLATLKISCRSDTVFYWNPMIRFVFIAWCMSTMCLKTTCQIPGRQAPALPSLLGTCTDRVCPLKQKINGGQYNSGMRIILKKMHVLRMQIHCLDDKGNSFNSIVSDDTDTYRTKWSILSGIMELALRQTSLFTFFSLVEGCLECLGK